MVRTPLPQSDEYALALRALGTRVRIDTITDAGRCLVQTRALPLIGHVNLISRGPVGLTPDDAAAYLHTLDLKGPLVVNAENHDFRSTGHIRLASAKSVALLPLSSPDRMRAALHQKWRNALNRVEDTGLRVTNTPYHPDRHSWMIGADAVQQKARRYRNWPLSLLNTFANENPGRARVITAYDAKTPLAAMLFLCHRPWATYHLGVTMPEGRHRNAHNLTLWHMMLWLTARGYTTLDLGLLTGPPGLDRFKLRTGAARHDLGGTWLRLPRLRRQFPSIQVPSGQKA
jgi:hypothetical protein